MLYIYLNIYLFNLNKMLENVIYLFKYITFSKLIIICIYKHLNINFILLI